MIVYSFEDQWLEWEPMIHQISFEFGGKAHRWGADHEDFRQECIAYMLENEKKLSNKRCEYDDAEYFGRYLAQCLRNNANDYIVDIRDQAGGQPRVSAYWYSTAELKSLLPAVFDRSKWLEPPQYDDGASRSKGIPSHGNNWVTTLADVSRAFDQLKYEDRQLLRQYHYIGERNKDLAADYDITEAAMSSRHTAALRRLQELLGGEKPKNMRPDVPHDPWRGRRAVSNTHAQAITRNSYES